MLLSEVAWPELPLLGRSSKLRGPARLMSNCKCEVKDRQASVLYA